MLKCLKITSNLIILNLQSYQLFFQRIVIGYNVICLQVSIEFVYTFDNDFSITVYDVQFYDIKQKENEVHTPEQSENYSSSSSLYWSQSEMCW